MNLIKAVSESFTNPEEAVAKAKELSQGSEVVFYFVDGENRVTTFSADFRPESPLKENQERIKLEYPEAVKSAENEDKEKEKEFFQNMGAALRGEGPWSRPV